MKMFVLLALLPKDCMKGSYQHNNNIAMYIEDFHYLNIIYTGVAGAGESITLSSNVSFTRDPVLCPNTLVGFECVGENLDTIHWRYNGTILVIYSFGNDGQPLIDSRRQPIGFEFSLENFNFNSEHRTANLTIKLVVELSAVYPGEDIQCVRSQALGCAFNVTYSPKSRLSESFNNN